MKRETTPLAANVGALWRRAIAELAHAFDPAREGDDRDSVFQTLSARERAEPRLETEDPLRPARPEETLQ